jgi:hypothetical protein
MYVCMFVDMCAKLAKQQLGAFCSYSVRSHCTRNTNSLASNKMYGQVKIVCNSQENDSKDLIKFQ